MIYGGLWIIGIAAALGCSPGANAQSLNDWQPCSCPHTRPHLQRRMEAPWTPEALCEKSNQQFGVFSTEISKAGSRVDRDHWSWHMHSTPVLHTSANLNPQFRRHLFMWFPYLTAIMRHEAGGNTFKFLVFCCVLFFWGRVSWSLCGPWTHYINVDVLNSLFFCNHFLSPGSLGVWPHAWISSLVLKKLLL